MRIDGKTILRRSPEELWDLLMNPIVLHRCIPGCERVEADGLHSFRLNLRLGMGLLKGRFRGVVRMLDVQRPESYRMVVEATGRTGSIFGENIVRLLPLEGGGTEVAYSGTGKVQGGVALFGGARLDSALREFSEKFFRTLATL